MICSFSIVSRIINNHFAKVMLNKCIFTQLARKSTGGSKTLCSDIFRISVMRFTSKTIPEHIHFSSYTQLGMKGWRKERRKGRKKIVILNSFTHSSFLFPFLDCRIILSALIWIIINRINKVLSLYWKKINVISQRITL